jgi:hypothetical protein
MHKWLNMKKLLAAVLLIALLLAPIAVYAQEEAPAETPATEQTSAPRGLGTLVLLIGLGALAVVGGRIWLRDRPDTETGS